jgi:hypothetical protein
VPVSITLPTLIGMPEQWEIRFSLMSPILELDTRPTAPYTNTFQTFCRRDGNHLLACCQLATSHRRIQTAMDSQARPTGWIRVSALACGNIGMHSPVDWLAGFFHSALPAHTFLVPGGGGPKTCCFWLLLISTFTTYRRQILVLGSCCALNILWACTCIIVH